MTASRPVIHRTDNADQLIELSHEANGATVRGVYSPELDRQLQELGEHNEETGEYYGYRDASDADEDRWSVRLHVERTAQQEREHFANIDNLEALKARASRSGTKFSEADYAVRGVQRMNLRLPSDVLERLDELVEETGARSRTEQIEQLINDAHAKLK